MRVTRAAFRALGVAATVAGAGAAGWAALVRAQGDSELAFESPTPRPGGATVRLVNRGKAGGVVHKVDGRLVAGGPGRVLVTRQGSKPPWAGWWESVCLPSGASCVAEVEVELDGPLPERGPVVVELDAHEIGRRLVVHRRFRFGVSQGP